MKERYNMKNKEIKLSPNISYNDVSYRVEQAKKFLKDGDNVKLTLSFKGREILHPEIGRNVLDHFILACYGEGRKMNDVRLDGKRMTVILRPVGKKDKNG